MDKELEDALAKLGESQKQAAANQAKAFEAFKAANEEAATKRDAVTDARLAKLTDALDRYEPLNKAVTAAEERAKAAKEALDEQQKQLDRIETKLNRPGAVEDGPSGEQKAQRSAFFDWVRYDLGRMQPDRKNVLKVSEDTGGGYLSPEEYLREIIKSEIEYSPMRQFVRVRTTSQKSVQVPRRTGTFAARWTGDTEDRTETEGLAYGMEDMPVHELTAEVYVSFANLEDSAFDIEAELNMEFAEQFGVAEGVAMILGSGVKKPEGILVAANTVEIVSGLATDFNADSLVDLTHGIKTAYAMRATLVLNRKTLGKTRKLKDGNGQYLWMPGLAQGKPNSIDGHPYVEMPDMPDVGAGATPVAFGDWQRAYTLADRLQMAVIRDGLTRASKGQVKFVARRRLGGQVTLAEAIGKLKCSV